MPRQNHILRVTAEAVQLSLVFLPHSFHGEVWRSGRLLLSISLVQLCAAHKPKPRRARFRALRLRSAPEIDSASLRSPLAIYETNVFFLAHLGPNSKRQEERTSHD